MTDFVYMEFKNPDTGEQVGHEFSDQPGVVEFYTARGWVKADPPPDKPFVSQHGDLDPEEPWVTLVHPGIQASHDFPNNQAAIEGAYKVGWLLPEERDAIEKSSKNVADEKMSAKKAATKTTPSAKADEAKDVK